MSPQHPLIVAEIDKQNVSVATKVIWLFAVGMINYRTDLGDSALNRVRQLMGDQQTEALMVLTGAAAVGTAGSWYNMLPEQFRK